MLWGLVAIGVWMGTQIVITMGFLIFSGAFQNIGENIEETERFMESIMLNGDLLGVMTLVGAIVGCPLCYYLGSMRQGFSGAHYLGLRRPRLLPLLACLCITGGLAFLFNQLAPHFQNPEDSEAMMEALGSMQYPLLLLGGVVIGAPLVEEFIFRGFLFRGFRASVLGLHGTVLLTTLVFTGLHAFQYGLFGLIYIFLLGLSFGYARHVTGSLWVPIAMHALNNAMASFELFKLVSESPG